MAQKTNSETKKEKYSKLAKLVEKYLCVPATSVNLKRVFSATESIISWRSKNVDLLIFLYKNKDTWFKVMISSFSYLSLKHKLLLL